MKFTTLVVGMTILVLIGSIALFSYTQSSRQSTPDPSEITTSSGTPQQDTPTQPAEPYKGEAVPIADSFAIKIPNGWAASISNKTSFLGVMFARPNQLESLVYNADTPPAIDQQGIPAWNGLTEHFFVITPTASRQFNPNDHLEITSEPFTFNDGTVGTRYYVIKHTSEAKKWGGLQKDTEWQGRTYIYEKDGKKIEAHLALYPSTKISIPFYESVIRTLSI